MDRKRVWICICCYSFSLSFNKARYFAKGWTFYAVFRLLLIASHGSSPVLSLLSFSRTLSCSSRPFLCSFSSFLPSLLCIRLTSAPSTIHFFSHFYFPSSPFSLPVPFFSLHNFPILFDFFDILISTTAGSSNCTTPQRNHYRNR